MTHTILAAILLLMPAPSPKWGESDAQFRERMGVIAEAIARASERTAAASRRQMAMALVVTFWGESRFSPLVQAGVRLGDGGRAICLGGIHQLELEHDEWLGLAGLDIESTTRCATVAAQRMKRAWRYCHEKQESASWPEAFVLYGTGRTCRASESRWKAIFDDRARKWQRLYTMPDVPRVQSPPVD